MIVSHETQQMRDFVTILLKWNEKINLISVNDLEEIWNRHVEDSKQVANFISTKDLVLDIGSGNGLPGIILSILGRNMILIEKDTRKAVFLEEVKRKIGLECKIICDRVEKIDINCKIITARAFSSIKNILSITSHIKYDKLVLLKGRSCIEEINDALRIWNFDYNLTASATSNDSHVLVLTNIKKKDDNKENSCY